MDEDLKIAVEYHESGKGLVSLGDLAELAREINKRDREIQQLQADKAELVEALGETLDLLMVTERLWSAEDNEAEAKARDVYRKYGGTQ